MKKFSPALAFALVLTSHTGLSGQAGRPSTSQSFTSTTTAILVDVVVRDKNGRPVVDLSAGDFEIAEDGVGQHVDSFTRVTRGGGIGVNVAWRSPETTIAVSSGRGSTSTAAADGQPADEDATTAIVFGHLSSESLGLAQRATLGYIPSSGESSARVAVFAADPGIRAVQGYTNDRRLVRQAVARVIPSETFGEEQTTERTDELVARRRELRGAGGVSAGSSAGSGTGAGLARTAAEQGERETELQLVQTELNMIRSFEQIDRDYKGYDIAQGLQVVVRSLAQYPGRKTIVFFSEGLPASPALSARLDSVIEAANRANVTTYAVDAHGLRAKSTTNAIRKEMDVFAEERMIQNATGVNRTEQPLTMSLERVEDMLQLDSRTGLARLSQDTGGFLIEGSNDLSAAFRRIDEDNQFHYLLTYSPKNAAFDGKFRAIQVTVHRPGVQVFSRKGYRAVSSPRLTDTANRDLPALALLDRSPLPNAFAVYAAGFSFPDAARPGLTPVLVHVGADALRFDVDSRRSTYVAQASIVVRIRDGQGREVEKVSQQYLLTGDAKDLEAARRGDILFYREPDLAPGVYTMESIVFDPVANQGSARVATLTIPAPERSALGMSSLVLVSRVEDLGDATAPSSPVVAPLYVGRSLIYPNLGEPITTSASSELPFYFTLYGAVEGVKAYAQLLRNGQVLAEAPIELPPSNSSRVQHVGRFPIGALPDGTYQLRIRVTDGRREVSRAAFFTLIQ
jgi:VWFA-related protein